MVSTPEVRRPFPLSLAAVALAAAIIELSAGGRRFHLPFELFPGAVYLAFLGAPIIARGNGAEDAASDLQLGAYLGPAYTTPSDVRLIQPGGTDLSFEGVSWLGRPFKPPPYYGYRAIYWLPRGKLGVMGDFTHIKAVSVKDSAVRQTGVRDGASVPAEEPLAATFKRLEFTHGYNLFTLNLLRRGASRGPWLIPYGGVGLGLAYPHVEMQRANLPVETRTFEYQIAGPAFQVLAGVEWRLGQRLSVFFEYKLSCAAIRGRLVGGGTLSTDLCTHQLLGGPAAHLRPRVAPT